MPRYDFFVNNYAANKVGETGFPIPALLPLNSCHAEWIDYAHLGSDYISLMTHVAATSTPSSKGKHTCVLPSFRSTGNEAWLLGFALHLTLR